MEKNRIIHIQNYLDKKTLDEIKEHTLIELDNTYISTTINNTSQALHNEIMECWYIIKDYSEVVNYLPLEYHDKINTIITYHILKKNTLESIKSSYDSFKENINELFKNV